MTYEEWVEQYRPIKNEIDTNASYEGMMFETYGDELTKVRQTWEKSPNTIWTLLEEDGTTWIGAGYHFVNRLGYFITEEPFYNENFEIIVDKQGVGSMNDHEVTSVSETFFSLQPDGEGVLRPTLSDEPGDGRTRAVCLTADDGRVEIHTDPEIVEAYLD